MTFTKEIISTLEDCGWYRERSILTTEMRDALISDGFYWSENADRFLTEFGNLTIYPVRVMESKFASGHFSTNPLLALGESSRISEREVDIGLRLTPIGEWMGEALILIDGSGKFYFETPYAFLHIADDKIRLFETLVLSIHHVSLVN